MSEQPFFISIPASIAKLNIPASHKMVAGSIFTRTYLRDKGGFVAIKVRYIVEDWGIQETAITASLKWLKDQGVIETKRTRYGTLIRWARSDVDETYEETQNHHENGDPEKRGPCIEGTQTPGISGLRSPKCGDALPILDPRLDTQIVNQQQERVDDDSFVRDQTSKTYLNPNEYQPKRARTATVLNQKQANLAAQLLGASGEDTKVATIATQDQADRTGFLEHCLKLVIDKRKSIKGSPLAYLRTVLESEWNQGRWVNPVDEEAKRKVEYEIRRAKRWGYALPEQGEAR